MSFSENDSPADVHADDGTSTFALPIITQDTQDILKLLNDSMYHLVSSTLLDNVQWAPSGRRYVLVTKEKTQNKFSPAQLECVTEINAEKFWLYTCRGWNSERGPSNNWANATPFEKARARGYLRRPQHPDLHHLWPSYMANIDTIITLATSTTKDTRVDHSVIENKEIKIWHFIFLVSLLIQQCHL
jgi:hypothetical protein